MSKAVFGRPLDEGVIEFGRVIDDVSTRPSTTKDISKQALIGGVRGTAGTYGDILDLLKLQSSEQLPGEKVVRQREFEILEKMNQDGYKPTFYDLLELTDDDIAPRFSRLPSSDAIENLIKAFGIETEPQTTGGKFSRRIGEAVGSGAALGANAGALGILGAGAGIGQGVEEITDSPTAGAAAEILSTLGIAGLGKKLAPITRESKDLVQRGRQIGLTEKEITPLVQNEKKLATFSKLARKGKKTQDTFVKINEKLGNAYDLLREEAATKGRLNLSQNEKLLKDFGQINKRLRTTIKSAPDKEAAIKFIEDSMETIRNRGATPEELINFWADINNAVNWNSVKGGKKSLNALKQPILEVLKEVDSKIARDFELTNQLYSQYRKAAQALKPDIVDKWLNKGEVGAIALALSTGNPAILKGIASESAIRILSNQILTNPRLQNISNKALQAVKNNKGGSVSQALRQTKKLLTKEYPDENWDFLEVEG